ncbi:recombinase family protein [Mediterraneibacter agrestimuris]|uniref:recombinase family protein n=1 Tax=Mediterraneibacter agrestimuris TaxID=2941333 RepID=UPI00203DCA0D|nr:recombinase family protein [Mediterraneibacter agrestimuris]
MALKKITNRGSAVSVRKTKVAIYIRVSTIHQVDKDSLPMQRQDLVAYCSLILGTDDYEIFEDAGYSGKNTNRPAFQDMMKRIRNDEFTHVLVWKIDRVSRNLLDFAEMYEELQHLRVTFVSKNEQFDTSTAIGEAMLKIILVFAELERNMTSERVTDAMISRASNGQWNGGRIPYGYDYDTESCEFSICNNEKNVCIIIKNDYIKNKSLTRTAKLLNSKGFRTRSGAEWSPTSVWIIVSSPFYAGIYRYNRYKGTENRTINPEEEWIMIHDHHPAIFTIEEHEKMLSILETNSRQRNSIGKQCTRDNIHIFSGIVYCGKCGCRLTSTPGRKHTDGYRTSIYSCPKKRKSDTCGNPSVNDLIVGEFVINYILNMLHAKKIFSSIIAPEELEKVLLRGSTFSDVVRIEENGLHDFFNLLSRYGSDNFYVFAIKKPRKKKATVNPELDSLRKEKEKQERALQRLQDLYLYSDSAISEKDFILRKLEITNRLDEITSQLGMITKSSESFLSDEDFIKQASHLLIQKELKERNYIYFKNLAQSVAPEILRMYMATLLDSVYVVDGRVSSIIFKNGLSHKFIYTDS